MKSIKSIKRLFNPYRGLPKEIYILFLGRIVNSIGAFVYPLMALILTQKVGMSKTDAGRFVTFISICQVPCMIIGGKLTDTIGRRKIIIIFQCLGAGALLVCGFLPPSMLMAKILVLSSCFYSLSGPAYDAMNADITTPENRKASFSLLYIGWNLGYSIGPILGGMLYRNYLPLVFIGDAVTTLFALSLFIIFIKETMVKNQQTEKKVEENDAEAHMEGSVFKVMIMRPILIIFPLIMLTYSFAYSQWGFTLPLQLGGVFGEKGAKFYGLLAGFNGIVVIAFTPALTAVTKKISALKIIAAGGFLYAISFGMFGVIKTMPFFFSGIFLMTIGEILISTNSSAFLASHTPASHRGRINSIIPLISGAGYAFGPMIMGQFIDNYGIFYAWMVISAVVLIGAILMLNTGWFDRKKAA